MWLREFTVLVLVLAASVADQKKCSYSLDLKIESTHDHQSPKFVLHNYNSSNAKCSYRITAPREYKISVSCEVSFRREYDREQLLYHQSDNASTNSCINGGVIISLTGNESLISNTYCGVGTFRDQSESNRLLLRMFSSSERLNYFCTLSLIATHCRCGEKYTLKSNGARIVNGAVAGLNEFPMMAGLAYQISNPHVINTPFCGAAINRYALSAAHCLSEYNPYPKRIILLAGGWLADVDNADKYRVLQIIIHPDYIAEPGPNDIAVVKTKDRIELDAFVGTVCLPWKYQGSTFTGKTVEVAGWGTMSSRGRDSEFLRKVTLDVIDNKSCATRWNSNIISGQICTYTPNKDSCQGDSGGPLFYAEPETKRLYLVGIVSYGKGCASETPAINTRVTEYLDWIEKQTRGSFMCRV